MKEILRVDAVSMGDHKEVSYLERLSTSFVIALISAETALRLSLSEAALSTSTALSIVLE